MWGGHLCVMHLLKSRGVGSIFLAWKTGMWLKFNIAPTPRIVCIAYSAAIAKAGFDKELRLL